ncbi:MAG: glycerol-3-phosphate 1-O-acyltransferase PlsY [Clostridia bacterium]|nr:glycerol-3-phosphate 1-O-acyltransferase PlsY [Clostridia bacterium]
MVYSALLSALVAYLLGSINSSIIVSKIFGEKDIRTKGSGNAGATNTLRVVGAKAAIFVVIGDALKGVLAILAARLISYHLFSIQNDAYNEYISAVAVVVGHVFPLYFGFKGGKGIMTAISVIFMLDWHIGLILVGVFALFIILFNYVSLSSCVSAFVYPFFVYYMHKGNTAFLISAVIVAIIAIAKHRTNICRLLNGTESKLFKSKNKSEVNSNVK